MTWWTALALAQEPPVEAPPSEEGDADEVTPEEAPPDPEEPTEDADEVLVIPPYNLGAGLDTLPAAIGATEPLPEGLDALARLDGIDWEARPSLLRGRWYLRPVVAYDLLASGDDRAGALRMGGALGRMWFTTGALPVQGGADVGLQATAPAGGALGYRVHAHGLVGPWLGAVGLRLGPTLRADRTRWSFDAGDLDLDHAVLVGARAVAALDLGSFGPYVSLEPAWGIQGTRERPTDPTLPALGTETLWGAGLTLQSGLLLVGAHLTRAETGVGGVDQFALSLALRPPPQRGAATE